MVGEQHIRVECAERRRGRRPHRLSDDPVTLRLHSPGFTVPEAGATLRFKLSMAVADESCDGDTLRVALVRAS